MEIQEVEVPGPRADKQSLIEFASTYNGYDRLNSDASELQRLFQPFEAEFQNTGRVSPSLGLDLLRGWLFALFRQDYFSGGIDWTETGNAWLERLWRAITREIADKSAGRVLLLE